MLQIPQIWHDQHGSRIDPKAAHQKIIVYIYIYIQKALLLALKVRFEQNYKPTKVLNVTALGKNVKLKKKTVSYPRSNMWSVVLYISVLPIHE